MKTVSQKILSGLIQGVHKFWQKHNGATDTYIGAQVIDIAVKSILVNDISAYFINQAISLIILSHGGCKSEILTSDFDKYLPGNLTKKETLLH